MKKVIVIGSGFAGLSAATCLAQEGFDVTVLEKNSTAGGRARNFESDGFVFDMGPSWYWMPDVYEKYFKRFGKRVADYYDLQRIDPSYRVFFGEENLVDVPSDISALHKLFESMEPGSSAQLTKFLEEGAFKYATGMNDLVYKPGLSWREFADTKLIAEAFRLNIFQSYAKYVRKFFKSRRLVSMLEFPVLFLGAPPDKIPALYSLMNYADMALGTWYPMGGMYKIIEAMLQLAQSLGVRFLFNSPVSQILVNTQTATGVSSNGTFHPADFIIAGADYHHVENDLLPQASRRYSDQYWNSRTLAPSCLIFYLGINKRIQNIQHHNLFFEEDIRQHIHEIYENPQWPTAPQFYVCCPSKTDPSVAPDGCENLFVLIPVAPGLEDGEAVREKYFSMVMRRMETITGTSIAPHVIFKRSYAHNDFVRDYHAFKGNAYGLANTLLQTANFKPGIVNKKVDNMFYTGQFTVPGPGVPPAIISGQIAAAALSRRSDAKNKKQFFSEPVS